MKHRQQLSSVVAECSGSGKVANVQWQVEVHGESVAVKTLLLVEVP